MIVVIIIIIVVIIAIISASSDNLTSRGPAHKLCGLTLIDHLDPKLQGSGWSLAQSARDKLKTC